MALGKIFNHPMFWVWFFVGIVVLSILTTLILQIGFQFTKTITIKNTYTRLSGRKMWYMVAATNGDLYRVGNLWWKGDFNEADDWANLAAGKTYKVRGYGIRVPALSWYPTIYELTAQ